jgi:putative ABC transport system permease protein
MAGLDRDGVALSEIAANSLEVDVGDALELTMGDGTPRALTVMAVYGRGLGFADLVMDHDVVAAHVDNPLSSSVLVELTKGAATRELHQIVNDYPGVRVMSPAQATASLDRQHQADAQVNYVALGLVVAFTTIAVVNTLAMSTADRSREFALLQLVGATRRQVRRMLVLGWAQRSRWPRWPCSARA